MTPQKTLGLIINMVISENPPTYSRKTAYFWKMWKIPDILKISIKTENMELS